MNDFAVGQRWVSAGELHLGVGLVIEVEFRTVSIIFPGTGETRVYAKQSAPLSRISFTAGDQIQDQQEHILQVQSVEQRNGLLTYICLNQEGDEVRLPEGKLSSYLKLNHPLQRMLNGQIDSNKWFELRARSQRLSSLLSQSSLQGLCGCRTSLIDHQLYIAHEVSRRFAPRVLLADEVGLGKTIEAGLIVHRQLLLERANRVLIVVPESLQHQWLVEMLRRFNLMFSLFDEARCEALNPVDVEASIQNPFETEQLVLCSLDFLRDHPDYYSQALSADWDMLVVDEAHHLVWQEDQPSDEYLLVEQLAQRIASVLLLTATPEQLGKESHFARLRLLDPDRFSDLQHFVDEESHYSELADIVDALNDNQPLSDAQLAQLESTVDEGDNRFQIDHLHDADDSVAQQAREQLIEHLLDRHGTGRLLFRNTRHAVEGFPAREMTAYPLACPELYQALYQELRVTEPTDPQWLLSPEIALRADNAVTASWIAEDPRVNWLVEFLRQRRTSKVLVICADAGTAIELVQAVRDASGAALAAFHEGLNLLERDRAAAWFADQVDGAQALICSEIGSEGRNFQFSHHLVLFDLPYNPDLLEQRIGRLDRIGQMSTIQVHVPYLSGSPQEVMLHWLHQSLNAFESTCPAGHDVYSRMQRELKTSLLNPAEVDSAFYRRSAELHDELNRKLLEGRDRLLEYNSCRPHQAERLRQAAEDFYQELELPRYIEQLYDCYGINHEIQGPGSWVVKPTDNMLAKVPGLPDDGMTVTYDRAVALANEDIRYLTWEHPFVRNLMDMLLSSELGNSALMALRYPGVKPGTLILDCFFRIDIPNAPGVDAQRYLSNNLIRVCIDESGNEHQQALSPALMKSNGQFVDLDTSIKVIKSREAVIKTLLQRAEESASQSIPEKQQQAELEARQVLGLELERLQALQTINPNVRDEEIDYFRDQLSQVNELVQRANLHLDATRVLVVV